MQSKVSQIWLLQGCQCSLTRNAKVIVLHRPVHGALYISNWSYSVNTLVLFNKCQPWFIITTTRQTLTPWPFMTQPTPPRPPKNASVATWEQSWEKVIYSFTILVTLVCQCFLWKVWTNDGRWPTSLACQIIWAAAETIFNSQAGSITRRWAYCIYQVSFTDQIFPHPDWRQYRTEY